jgi:hypothetical protein
MEHAFKGEPGVHLQGLLGKGTVALSNFWGKRPIGHCNALRSR